MTVRLFHASQFCSHQTRRIQNATLAVDDYSLVTIAKSKQDLVIRLPLILSTCASLGHCRRKRLSPDTPKYSVNNTDKSAVTNCGLGRQFQPQILIELVIALKAVTTSFNLVNHSGQCRPSCAAVITVAKFPILMQLSQLLVS